MICPPALLHRFSKAISGMAIAANTATTTRKAIPTIIARTLVQPAVRIASGPCFGFQVWPSHQKRPSGDSHCLPSHVTESGVAGGICASLWFRIVQKERIAGNVRPLRCLSQFRSVSKWSQSRPQLTRFSVESGLRVLGAGPVKWSLTANMTAKPMDACGRGQTIKDCSPLVIEPVRTLLDGLRTLIRGLQNRLRSSTDVPSSSLSYADVHGVSR